MDGVCTLGEAEGETLPAGPERGSRSAGSTLCLARYLLGVLGDPFCQAVRRDRDAWPRAPGRPEGEYMGTGAWGGAGSTGGAEGYVSLQG